MIIFQFEQFYLKIILTNFKSKKQFNDNKAKYILVINIIILASKT